MISHKLVRIFLGAMILSQAVSMHTSYGVQRRGVIPRIAGWIGGQVADAASSFFDNLTAGGLSQQQIGKTFNKAAQGIGNALKQMDSGPAIRELQTMISQHRNAIIRGTALTMIGFAIVSSIAAGIGY